MRRTSLIHLLLLWPLASCAPVRGAAPATPAGVPPAPRATRPPRTPALGRPAAWGRPAPLVDDRAARWGGDLGLLAQVRWIAITQQTELHAHRAGWIERRDVLIVRRAPAGLEWARTHSDGAVEVTDRGVIGTTTVIEVDRGRAVARTYRETFTPFEPVPAARVAALAAAVARAPVPARATAPVWQGLTIEVSTDAAHVLAHAEGSLGPALVAGPAPAPHAGPSRSLAEMAERLGALRP